jgi:heme-degrading monooxygenase HmoA
VLVVLFRIRARRDVDEGAYGAAFEQMLAGARATPGFVSFDSYSAEDGAELAVAVFEDDLALERWREDPDHVITRRRGHDEFFESYDITIATVGRQYAWTRADDIAQRP